jgi:hypothetical protein
LDGEQTVNSPHDSTVSEVERPLSDKVQQQVGKVLGSKIFRNASALQRLLNYVTAVALRGAADQLKEYTIGSEVFGRGSDYDPKIDTVVRVEMHRLREKLREYYEADGAADPILIEIPKGHYLPTFEIRNTSCSTPSESSAQRKPSPQAKQVSPSQAPAGEQINSEVVASRVPSLRWHTIALAALVLFASGLIAGAWWAKSRSPSREVVGSRQSTEPSSKPEGIVQEFWRSFLGNDATPIVGYPDAVFLIDETNDLFRFRRGASDARCEILQGIGGEKPYRHRASFSSPVEGQRDGWAGCSGCPPSDGSHGPSTYLPTRNWKRMSFAHPPGCCTSAGQERIIWKLPS